MHGCLSTHLLLRFIVRPSMLLMRTVVYNYFHKYAKKVKEKEKRNHEKQKKKVIYGIVYKEPGEKCVFIKF